MNLRPLGFIDTSLLTATLLTRHKNLFDADTRRQEHLGSPHHDTKSILLRGPKSADAENWFLDVPHIDYPILGEWKQAKNFIGRLRHAASQFLNGRPAMLGKVMIVSLKVGGHVDWHTDEGEYAELYDRIHVCLVPSPGALTYSGGEAANLPVGQITFVNNRVLHSAINLGPVPRIHLIADVRKTEPEE